MEFARALLVILFSFVIGNSDDAVAECTDDTDAQPTQLKLRRRIFCGYDRNVQPVKEHSSYTEIILALYPQSMELFEFYNTFQINGYTTLEWIDENLNWNKTEYDNIEMIDVSGGSIWVPDFQYDEMPNHEATSHLVGNTPCTLKSSGLIKCVVRTMYSTLCEADVRRWPFDKHSCRMSIRSWSKTQNLNITLKGKNGISKSSYRPSRVWEVLNTPVIRRELVTYLTPNDYRVEVTRLRFTFILRRYSGEGAAGIFVPAIVLSCVTWVSFLLDSRSSERLAVIYINIFSHCLYLVHMCFRIPPNSGITPFIVLFYGDSLLMAASSLIITILVRKMDASASQPPAWVAGVVNGVLATLPGQILLLSGVDPKDAAAVGEAENSEVIQIGPSKWHQFGAILDYLSLGACVITTIVLLINFLP